VIPERPVIERRILAALDANPPRIPVLLGGCGSGRTSLLLRVGQILGDQGSQYLDIERAASTPEGFYASITRDSPYRMKTDHDPADGEPATAPAPGTARGAFDSLLAFLRDARSPDGRRPVFLIDELLEVRTFESFPGLRGIQRELIDVMATSSSRFVVSTRYTTRAHRLLRDAPGRFEVIHIAALSPSEVSEALRVQEVGHDDAERIELGRMIHVLTDGRPAYVQAVALALRAMDGASSGDPVSALAAQLSTNAHLSLVCRFSYELRLHRARGYGALKAILQVLAQDEPLTLTEIAHRLGRTPGSTKDYLTWLEDVDLVSAQHKRYSYGDPLLRLWVRLHCRPTPPTDADLSREVQEYAVSRLPYMEPAPAFDGPGEQSQEAATHDVAAEKAWSIIEID
jgi:hypothetical protein